MQSGRRGNLYLYLNPSLPAPRMLSFPALTALAPSAAYPAVSPGLLSPIHKGGLRRIFNPLSPC